MHNVHSVCLFTAWKRPAPSVYECKDKQRSFLYLIICTMDSNMVGLNYLN